MSEYCRVEEAYLLLNATLASRGAADVEIVITIADNSSLHVLITIKYNLSF